MQDVAVQRSLSAEFDCQSCNEFAHLPRDDKKIPRSSSQYYPHILAQ